MQKIEDVLITKPFGTYLRCVVCQAWDQMILQQHQRGCPVPDWVEMQNGRSAHNNAPFSQYDKNELLELERAIREVSAACGHPAVDASSRNATVESELLLYAAARLKERIKIELQPPFVQPADIKPITIEGVELLMNAQVDGVESTYFTYAPQMRELCKYALAGMRQASSNEEESKLVAFFCSEEGKRLGMEGDHDGLTPAATAIRAMKSYLELRARAGAALDVLKEALGII